MLQQVMSVYIVMRHLDSHPLMEQNLEEPDTSGECRQILWRLPVEMDMSKNQHCKTRANLQSVD